MDIRQYINDEARFTLRPRLVWRVLLPVATAWTLYNGLRDPDQLTAALALALLFAGGTTAAWLWKVEVDGRLVRAHRPPRPEVRVQMSRLTSEGAEWAWYVRYVARHLILEDASGEQLTLTWIWWSNWSLLHLVAHEWHMRSGRPYQ